MQRRQFMMVLASGGAAIALAACDAMPPSAVAPWNGPGSEEQDPRLRALSWAMLAPNPHNLQSWLADIRVPGLIKLHVDLQRLLPQTDPPNRQILIGCGAFLELLRMAASHDGWRADVELFPEGEYRSDGVDARPFAQIRLVRDSTVAPDPLFSVVQQRRTNRLPYEAKVPDANTLSSLALNSLASIAKQSTVTLVATNSPEKVKRIRDLAIAGYRVEFTNQATWNESADALRLGAQAVAAEPSGIAALGTEVWWGRKLHLLTPASVRKIDGMAASRAIKDSIDAANNTYAWFWLVSADNSRHTQIDAGRAFLRADLAAASLGLAIQPNSQVLQEFPAMRQLYQDFHREVDVTEPARVQMLARIGYATRPNPAPRRAVTSVVRV